MPCYSPLRAWRDDEPNKNSKRPMVFKKPSSQCDEDAIELSCGRCIGCRLDRSLAWALRCMHESQLHSENCFITLTYRPEDTPKYGSLNKKDFQDFMKRLRWHFNDKTIKYYMCGEYGENLEHSKNYKFGHPHYHACIFGLDFKDLELHQAKDGYKIYKSKTLEDIWGKGFCTVGELTMESAAYTARYVMKKALGNHAKEKKGALQISHYECVLFDTGEVVEVEPEYTSMSRGNRLRPDNGIGKTWYDSFKADLEKDFITKGGKPVKIPKYYDKLREKENPEKMDEIKEKRAEKARLSKKGDEYWRRLDAEKIKLKRIKTLQRNKI
jgi:hypothetical protein